MEADFASATCCTTCLESFHLAAIGRRIPGSLGDNVMIGGSIIQETGPKRMIVRGIGPELSPIWGS